MQKTVSSAMQRKCITELYIKMNKFDIFFSKCLAEFDIADGGVVSTSSQIDHLLRNRFAPTTMANINHRFILIVIGLSQLEKVNIAGRQNLFIATIAPL